MENLCTLENYVVLPPRFDTHRRGVGPQVNLNTREKGEIVNREQKRGGTCSMIVKNSQRGLVIIGSEN